MSDAEDRLRALRTKAEKKNAEYSGAVARAQALKEQHDQNLARLKDEFGVATIAEAEQQATELEQSIQQRLTELDEQL